MDNLIGDLNDAIGNSEHSTGALYLSYDKSDPQEHRYWWAEVPQVNIGIIDEGIVD
jgi:hypothetical protein